MKTESIASVLFIPVVLIFFSCTNFYHEKKASNMNSQLSIDRMPIRRGERPSTTNTNPHTQLNQQPEDISYVKELTDWAFKLSNIKKKPSLVSVPGAIAMFMEDEHSCDGCNAFMAGTEFAHFHPDPDYSLHLSLPKKDAETIINKGWGEWHPLIKRGILPPNIVMLYAPRNQEELEVARVILRCSYSFAQGEIKESRL